MSKNIYHGGADLSSLHSTNLINRGDRVTILDKVDLGYDSARKEHNAYLSEDERIDVFTAAIFVIANWFVDFLR